MHRGEFQPVRILRIDSAVCFLYSDHRGQHHFNPALIEHVPPRFPWQPCSSISSQECCTGFEKGEQQLPIADRQLRSRSQPSPVHPSIILGSIPPGGFA